MYYSSTNPYYKVLLRYYKVLRQHYLYYKGLLQYSSTTLYYKRLRQYYSVLQSTTTYYSSTTLYYKGLRQHYSVLQSTTTYYSGTTLKRHLQCAEQVKSPSNLTKYCACHAKWTSSMICVTCETSFPMRGASEVTLQPHQMLRLPHKINVTSDLRHMKRHFQCAEQVKSPSNLTKCCACHTKSMSPVICVTYETSFPMRGAGQVTLQTHQILRLPRNLDALDFSGNSFKCFRQ